MRTRQPPKDDTIVDSIDFSISINDSAPEVIESKRLKALPKINANLTGEANEFMMLLSYESHDEV
jgi:hypothetical protein